MTSQEYANLLGDPRWISRRREILEARGRRCEDCGSEELELNIHHGYYRAGRMPWDYPDNALHVLCSRCHTDAHFPVMEPVKPLVNVLAARLSSPPRTPEDPRKALWETAQANERPGVSATALMGLLSWLYFKRGVRDMAVLDRVTRVIHQARNPYALLQPGGLAIERLIGDAAVERNTAESNQAAAETRAFLGVAR